MCKFSRTILIYATQKYNIFNNFVTKIIKKKRVNKVVQSL